jgi:hypothetical protein
VSREIKRRRKKKKRKGVKKRKRKKERKKINYLFFRSYDLQFILTIINE